MNLNPRITGKHMLALASLGLLVLVAYKIKQSKDAEALRFQAEVSLQTIKPTAEEALKWALWEAQGQHYSFDVVSTNVVESPEDVRYSGRKRAGEDAMDRRMFGAAYDAWSQGDSFTRRKTNYTCSLVVKHTKPKPEHKKSRYFSNDGNVVAPFLDRPPVDMLAGGIVGMLKRKFSRFELVATNYYKVNRIEGGRLMKPVPGSVGPMYMWDTEEREKFYVTPTWVVVVEARNLTPKAN